MIESIEVNPLESNSISTNYLQSPNKNQKYKQIQNSLLDLPQRGSKTFTLGFK